MLIWDTEMRCWDKMLIWDAEMRCLDEMLIYMRNWDEMLRWEADMRWWYEMLRLDGMTIITYYEMLRLQRRCLNVHCTCIILKDAEMMGHRDELSIDKLYIDGPWHFLYRVKWFIVNMVQCCTVTEFKRYIETLWCLLTHLCIFFLWDETSNATP